MMHAQSIQNELQTGLKNPSYQKKANIAKWFGNGAQLMKLKRK